MKFTTSDGNGNFAFYGVPSGSYYVIGSVVSSTHKVRITDKIYVGDRGIVQTELARGVK